MDKTKNRWLLFLVLILLISNLVLAFFYFMDEKSGTERRKNQQDFAMTVYKEIGLSDTQIDTFKVLKDEFFKEMKPMWGEIRSLKDSLYRNMGKSMSDSASVQLMDQIAAKNSTADKKMYDHFRRLRSLCNDEQKVRFDTIVPKLVNRSWRRK